MSPLPDIGRPVIARFPRLRGDEPGAVIARLTDRAVFPAYAGMSRVRRTKSASPSRFLRLRGDEPITLSNSTRLRAFSPPTRG